MGMIIFIVTLLFSVTGYSAQTTFFVNGLTCPFCAMSIEKAFNKIDGYEVESVKVKSLKTGEVEVKTKGDKSLTEEVIKKELKETDFSLREIKK